MAIDWGAWVYGGGNGMRVGIEAVSWTGVAWNSSSSTLTFHVWTQNQYNYNDAQTVTYTGGSLNYQNSQASGTQTRRVTNATATYTYGANPGTLTISATLSGLYNGSTLRPTVSVGYTSPTRPAPTAPSAPGISVNALGNGYVDFNFSDPADWGSGGGSYWQYSSDNVNWTNYPANPFRITGANGSTVTGYIRAVNGAGLTSTSSASGIPRTIPGAPASVSSTPYNGYISVSYTAPSSDGGNSIKSYQYSTNAGASWTTTPSNPFNVSGANGTEITVYVRALNDAGAGGSTSATSTPRTVPGIPQSLNGNNTVFGQISLSWSPPTSNGGATISGYTLKRGTTTLFTNSNQTSYIDTGLLPYTDYTYTVSAVNVAGTGAETTQYVIKTLGGIAKIWNGSTYVTVLPKIWNGSVWVDSQARMWNGTEWKHGI